MNDETEGQIPPLDGVRVVDTATLFAGPLAATMMGDFGAEVIKVEHPEMGDPARQHSESKNGVGLWWKMLARNKRAVTLNLGKPMGREVFLKLARESDVIIESFRPGTFERWGLSYEELTAENPGLILARVSGFGRTGPYANRAGYGTLAEAMCGFAHITGQPDGPPTLPPFGLADGVSALVLLFGIMGALRTRDATGQGQVVDVALIEPLMTLLGPQPMVYDQLGKIQQRIGNRTTSNAPRNTYKSSDGVWLAVSASSLTVARRLMKLVGRPELIEEEWFATSQGRADHVEILDKVVSDWIGARTADDVVAEFERAEAAIGPVLDIAGIFEHPQYQAMNSIIKVPDDDLGEIAMQNVPVRLSSTPGSIRWTGRAMGEDNEEVFGDLGYSPEQLTTLKTEGIL